MAAAGLLVVERSRQFTFKGFHARPLRSRGTRGPQARGAALTGERGGDVISLHCCQVHFFLFFRPPFFAAALSSEDGASAVSSVSTCLRGLPRGLATGMTGSPPSAPSSGTKTTTPT